MIRTTSIGVLVGTLAFAVGIAALAWRITIGIDLGDESYYAMFIDDWLKGNVASSTFLTIYQTAALIIYPAARLFTHLVGSTDGLILFFRILYLAGALAAAGAWYMLMRSVGSNAYACWASALACFTFIPFGLPAPSYNTIGMQSLLIALSTFGCAAIPASERQNLWLSVSAVAWGIAVVAHPALVVPLVVLSFVILVFRRTLAFSIRYIVLIAVFQLLGWGIVLSVLSWSRLSGSVLYLAAINDVGGILKKLTLSVQLFGHHPFFIGLVSVAVVIGLLRNRLGAGVLGGLVILVFALSYVGRPTLFAHSHDLIVLAALMGLGLLAGFDAKASDGDRTVAIIYTVSMSAGITTAATATHGLFNFCIGAAPAALLSIFTIHSKRTIGSLVSAGAQFALLGFLLYESLTFYYGETPDQSGRRTRIDWGAFTGILARDHERELLNIMREHVGPLVSEERTILVIGRVPGLTLATNARPRALTTFPLSHSAHPDGILLTRAFYEVDSNRPHVVVVYTDPYYPEPLNPMGARFDEWYVAVGQHHVPPGVLTIFLKRPYVQDNRK